MSEHKMINEGSDCLPRRMIAGCTCGWWGEVIEGQGPDSQAKAREQFEKHVKECTK